MIVVAQCHIRCFKAAGKKSLIVLELRSLRSHSQLSQFVLRARRKNPFCESPTHLVFKSYGSGNTWHPLLYG